MAAHIAPWFSSAEASPYGSTCPPLTRQRSNWLGSCEKHLLTPLSMIAVLNEPTPYALSAAGQPTLGWRNCQ
jgi:hypothetical protein